MTHYRVIFQRTPQNQEWEPVAVAYEEANLLLLFQLDQKYPFQLRASNLYDLQEKDIPQKPDHAYQLGEVKSWNRPEPFDPALLLQIKPGVTQSQRHRLDLRKNLRPDNYPQFVDTSRWDPDLVTAQWQRWVQYFHNKPLYPHPEENVALLLYARAFGLPVADHPFQLEYLEKHKHLFAPLAAKPREWGARASLSETLFASPDAPVMQVLVYEEGDDPQRIIIVGKGLSLCREKVLYDALVTAMRVQASDTDIFNDGLIIIERKAGAEDSLDINLPIWGANAPLADAGKAAAVMRELARRLERLAEDTGFVQIHKTKYADAQKMGPFLRKLAVEAVETEMPIAWALDNDALAHNEELVTVQQILNLSPKRQRQRRRTRIEPVQLNLTPHLLYTPAWELLRGTYTDHVINHIAFDAQIRLAYYRERMNDLREKVDQWKKADKRQREKRWGPTMTLNQRFDDALGLTIWLQPPEIIPTKTYFEVNAPHLILSYEEWVAKMTEILNNLHSAASRSDRPFHRLLTTRFFDAALRERDLALPPKIQKLFVEWAEPMADLLRFEWRQYFNRLGALPDDLFTSHTTFKMVQITDRPGRHLHALLMEPLTLIDLKRSAVLFDTERHFMIVRDPSDYPQKADNRPAVDDLQKELKQQLQKGSDASQLAVWLRQQLIRSPGRMSKQIMQLLRPQTTQNELEKDARHVEQLYRQGLAHTFEFPRLLDRADTAMWCSALLTARAGLSTARQVLPDLWARWKEMRQSISEHKQQSLPDLPDEKELKCRLYLLEAVVECIMTNPNVKDYLPTIYRSPQPGGREQITEALAMADSIDANYTGEWIGHLAEWDFSAAYNKLMRDLPSEQDLTSVAEHHAIRVFDALELMQIAAILEQATESLSHAQETRATTLAKLGPALDLALLSFAANVAYGDLKQLLDILTGVEKASEVKRVTYEQ